MEHLLVDPIVSLYARFVGRPWQRRRAQRLIERGKVRCILFEAGEGVLPSGALDGVADVGDKRLRLQGVELWVRGIEGAPDEGPIALFAQDGKFHPSTGNLVFEPRTRVYDLRLHSGKTVRCAVLAFQANQALDLLGFGEADSEPQAG